MHIWAELMSLIGSSVTDKCSFSNAASFCYTFVFALFLFELGSLLDLLFPSVIYWMWYFISVIVATFILHIVLDSVFLTLFLTGFLFSPPSVQSLVPFLCSYSCLTVRPCQSLYLRLLQVQVYIFQLQFLWVFYYLYHVNKVFTVFAAYY